VRARLDALLRRLGVAGVLGVGLLLACAGFWASALQPVQQELAARRLALADVQSRATRPGEPALDDPQAALRRFHERFPSTNALTDELERVHRLARRAGLDLAQGEYRLERRPAGLWAYRVTLPVRGTYSDLREFLGAVLKDAPAASIEAMRFERKRADDPQLEAQVRLTLHLRPPAER